MDILAQTYVHDVLHIIAQALLVPTLVVLIALIVYVLWCIGSVIAESFTERRHFRINMPSFLDRIETASPSELHDVIAASNLLGWQKRVLLRIWDYRTLEVDAHVALAKRLLEEQDSIRAMKVDRTSTISRIAPQLGLMATLIPLGPGIVSLSTGDTATLSSSLLVAFDATVAGLVVSAVSFVVSRIRKSWYEDYMSALEAGSTAILEKVDEMRRADGMDVSEPTSFADMYPDLREARELERVRKWKEKENSSKSGRTREREAKTLYESARAADCVSGQGDNPAGGRPADDR